MLHLRVIVPTDESDGVVDFLRTALGVTHLVVSPGVAVEPAGDLIEADVTREAADVVLGELTDRGVDRRGAVTMEPIDTVLSDSASRAEREAPGDPDDAIVWDELTERTRDDATLNVTFVSFLIIACLLAAVGVVTDSPVTIVGAMVVGPEFGPLAGIAVGVVAGQSRLARRSAIALLVGFPLAMVVTGLAAALGEVTGLVDLGDITSAHQVDFVYRVGVFSFVVALLAGAAGMLSLVSSKSAALVGVFISVTTVPAAGYAVIAATLGQWSVAGQSAAQLAVNMVGIVVAGIAVLWMHRAAARRRAARNTHGERATHR
ncbi:TIGR00341 family protein [Williamsia sp. SKLECPSW1]